MTELDEIREAQASARQRCARCGEERQSHAFVQGVYGALWVCPSVIFVPQSDSRASVDPAASWTGGSPRTHRRTLRAPVYDSPERCHSDGATPTNRKTGLCRHCDEGGDDE
jgi:ribosomal protein S14